MRLHSLLATSFQSTHPVWDGTAGRGSGGRDPQISIHPSRVGWDTTFSGSAAGLKISIHPSRVGWDCSWTLTSSKCSSFQSTHPVWDGTHYFPRNPQRTMISIHPSRVGWDISCWGWSRFARHFNPPIPCGMGRPVGCRKRAEGRISIHPSRVGWDLVSKLDAMEKKVFQSTHPVWDGTIALQRPCATQTHFNPPIPCGMGPNAQIAGL